MDAFREPELRRRSRQAVTLTRAIRAGRTHAKSSPPQSRQVRGAALCDLVAEVAAESELVEIAASRPPWASTRMRIASGEQVTWLAWGLVHLVKPLGIAGNPSLVLAARVAGGSVQRSPRDTFTFMADRDGQVEFASLAPGGGEPQPDGSVKTDRVPYRMFRGTLSAVVARWGSGTDPRDALASIAPRDTSGLCSDEVARLDNPSRPPAGWEHHPLLAREEVYTPTANGIAADCRQTVGIIRRRADVPLTPTLQLRWSWRLDELPSQLPEDTTLTHDYLSIALEFDDGQDLTWFWSSSLPVGFAYRCPLEHWRHRETHIVARTGRADLGRWVDDARPVLADHRAAIGGSPPARVVNAWLIAVSGFQRHEARGEFGRIELVDGDLVTRVL